MKEFESRGVEASELPVLPGWLLYVLCGPEETRMRRRQRHTGDVPVSCWAVCLCRPDDCVHGGEARRYHVQCDPEDRMVARTRTQG